MKKKNKSEKMVKVIEAKKGKHGKRAEVKVGEKKGKKRTMKEAVKLFNTIKKSISQAKRSMKAVAKFMSEANKTGDEQYIARVMKYFKLLDLVVTEENTLVLKKAVKVKPMKVKKVKKEDKVTPTEDDLEDEEEEDPDKTQISVPELLSDVEASEGAVSEEEEEEEDEEEEVSPRREDEDDEEYEARVEEERQMARDAADADAAAREMILAEQEDNGDFS